jgi:hypothetical protein
MSPNTSIGALGSRVLDGSLFDVDGVLLLGFRCGSLGGNESIICTNSKRNWLRICNT